jgi:hypothetical protein
MVILMTGQAFCIQSKVSEFFLLYFLIFNEVGFMAISTFFLTVSPGQWEPCQGMVELCLVKPDDLEFLSMMIAVA